jgi:hypothetical protein
MTESIIALKIISQDREWRVDYNFEDYKPRLTMTKSIIALKI